jgi:type I restriction enzyme R subunit
MIDIKTEKTFKTDIIESLVEQGGYDQGNADDYSVELGMFKSDVISFIQTTQPEKWTKLEAIHGSDCPKYQTGFDQPLLHTMYVNKKLSGVKAVQTLSRLNRTCPGKDDTFVLDFVIDRETILSSFQPYYEITTVVSEPDPNHLYDLKAKLDEKQIYWQSEIEAFSRVYFKDSRRLTVKDQAALLTGLMMYAACSLCFRTWDSIWTAIAI